MADSLQIRAGTKAKMPTLAVRELVYCTDEQALYIGTATGNIKLCAAALEGIVNAHSNSINSLSDEISAIKNQLPSKLTAGKVAAQAAVAADADTAAIITAVNNLIAAMKASGVMNN